MVLWHSYGYAGLAHELKHVGIQPEPLNPRRLLDVLCLYVWRSVAACELIAWRRKRGSVRPSNFEGWAPNVPQCQVQ